MAQTLPESLRLLMPDGTVKRVLLEDYIRGVVAAALPADTPLEAMKALAVAARTFAAHTHRHLDRDADVCTLRHCQAWSERANPRAARAALETRGMVATYNDELIEAFYFDHCDGKTRDAAGVLLNAPQYLKGVSCPCGSATMRGHGIGMCQRGMIAMARFGESSNYILRHYYSGVQLQTLEVDPASRVQETAAAAASVRRPQAYRTVLPTRHDPPLPNPGPNAPPPEIPVAPPIEPKPARKPTTRRPTRARPEPTPAPEAAVETPAAPETTAPVPAAPPPEEAKPPTAPIAAAPSEPPIAVAPPAPTVYETIDLLDRDSDTQEDDLLFFLAVRDIPPAPVAPPKETIVAPPPIAEPPPPLTEPPPTAPPQTTPFQYNAFQYMAPPVTFTPPAAPPPLPPDSMPEDLPAPEPIIFEPPPFSMPEAMPSALELDFLAPPTGLPEELPAHESVDFAAQASHEIEPNLEYFIPPIEKFYTPLDAPPSMPEGMPAFDSAHSDDTPFSWVPPPPMQETAYEVRKPQILMDSLPGPRIIAGNLPKPGMLITIRDARGNSIVTVSGVAKHYGPGGFEAPLTDDGIYGVKFDGSEMDIKLNNETVFIYYQ